MYVIIKLAPFYLFVNKYRLSRYHAIVVCVPILKEIKNTVNVIGLKPKNLIATMTYPKNNSAIGNITNPILHKISCHFFTIIPPYKNNSSICYYCSFKSMCRFRFDDIHRSKYIVVICAIIDLNVASYNNSNSLGCFVTSTSCSSKIS